MTGNNYEEAIRILKDRFGNVTEVTREHFNKLHGLKHVSVKNIRRFFDDVVIHTRNLSKLDVHVGDYEVMLLPILLAKLPEEVQLSMFQRSNIDGRSISKLDYFLRLLEAEITVREFIKDEKSSSASQNEAGRVFSARLPLAATLATKISTKISSNADSAAQSCKYCNQDHDSKSCNTVTDVTQRIEILKRKGLCFRCWT